MLAITTFLLLLPVFGAFSTSWADPYPYYLQPAYGYPEEYTTKILSIINKARTTEGLPALCNNKKLQAAAMRLCYKDAPGDYVWRFRSDQNKLSRLATDEGFVCDSSTGLPSGSPNCSNVGGFADSGEINTDEAVAGWVADFWGTTRWSARLMRLSMNRTLNTTGHKSTPLVVPRSATLMKKNQSAKSREPRSVTDFV
ncbi:hypothetical protein P3T76_004042 [Phytophthora citrophthora]|uniref:SCP domain-containing protein n=1 Tax=Phytophthora citrophthora TaxID=4793 RepID=A0AAD9GT82_9STRA|nr:hypothetical protein P3T76_004042 [Phytophthora citrophthora]